MESISVPLHRAAMSSVRTSRVIPREEGLRACILDVWRSSVPGAVWSSGLWASVAYSVVQSARPAANSTLALALTAHPYRVSAGVATLLLGYNALRASDRCELCWVLAMADASSAGAALRSLYAGAYPDSPLLEHVSQIAASPLTWPERAAALEARLRPRPQQPRGAEEGHPARPPSGGDAAETRSDASSRQEELNAQRREAGPQVWAPPRGSGSSSAENELVEGENGFKAHASPDSARRLSHWDEDQWEQRVADDGDPWAPQPEKENHVSSSKAPPSRRTVAAVPSQEDPSDGADVDAWPTWDDHDGGARVAGQRAPPTARVPSYEARRREREMRRQRAAGREGEGLR